MPTALTSSISYRYENWQRAVRLYSSNAAVGWRPLSPSGEALDFEWMTYAQVYDRAEHFGSGLRSLGLCPGTEDFSSGLMGFYAKNRPEWSIGMYVLTLFSRSRVVRASLPPPLPPRARFPWSHPPHCMLPPPPISPPFHTFHPFHPPPHPSLPPPPRPGSAATATA
jgi:hypothetical protein